MVMNQDLASGFAVYKIKKILSFLQIAKGVSMLENSFLDILMGIFAELSPEFIALYLLSGAVTGILAGLLGIGGGIVIVPMMNILLEMEHVSPDLIQHISVGTSFAIIIFTSLSNVWAQHKLGGVRWDIWKAIAPAVIVGTVLGSYIAAGLSTFFLRCFFACFLTIVGIKMLMAANPKPSRHLPGTAGMFGIGGGIGLISSFVGIGGGTMSVPFMTWCNVPMVQSVGTSAAIGMPLAIAGAAGYVWNGWNIASLPPYSLGFVYLPGLIGFVVASMLTAPIGVKIAHKLPVKQLKRFFGLFVCVMAARMFYSLFF